jgi:hypothetical protein
MSIATLIRQMSEAGAPAEAIALAVEAIEAAGAKDADRRAKQASRKARSRAVAGQERDSDVTVTGQGCDSPPSPALSPQTPQPHPHPPENKLPAREEQSPMGRSEASKCFDKTLITQALGQVLDAEHAEAVADYRTKGRKDKFSLYAAGLLAKELAKAEDPNAAADAMIRNGWQGFEADWLHKRQNLRVVNGQGPPKRQSNRESLAETGRRMLAEERGEPQRDHWQGSMIDGYANTRQ